MSACPRCGIENIAWPCNQCGYTPTATSPSVPSQPRAPSPLVDPWAPVPAPSEPSQDVLASPPPAPSGKRRSRRLLIGGLCVLGLVAGLGWAVNASEDRGGGTTAPPTVAKTVGSSAPATATSAPQAAASSRPPPSTRQAKTARQLRSEALATLAQLVESDAEKDPIRGQWVAQLASKYEGVIDKTQQSKPFTVPQILAEVNRHLRNPEYGSEVRVVLQGDWGGSTAGARPLWVTFADIDGSSRAEVVAWCESRFKQRGQALLNVCYPREMRRK